MRSPTSRQYDTNTQHQSARLAKKKAQPQALSPKEVLHESGHERVTAICKGRQSNFCLPQPSPFERPQAVTERNIVTRPTKGEVWYCAKRHNLSMQFIAKGQGFPSVAWKYNKANWVRFSSPSRISTWLTWFLTL